MFELALNAQSEPEHIPESGCHTHDHQTQRDEDSEMLLSVFEYGLRIEPTDDTGNTDFQ